MLIDKAKGIFEGKTVELKLDKYVFTNTVATFKDGFVEGTQNGKIMFRLSNDIVLKAIDDVDLVIKGGTNGQIGLPTRKTRRTIKETGEKQAGLQ